MLSNPTDNGVVSSKHVSRSLRQFSAALQTHNTCHAFPPDESTCSISPGQLARCFEQVLGIEQLTGGSINTSPVNRPAGSVCCFGYFQPNRPKTLVLWYKHRLYGHPKGAPPPLGARNGPPHCLAQPELNPSDRTDTDYSALRVSQGAA